MGHPRLEATLGLYLSELGLLLFGPKKICSTVTCPEMSGSMPSLLRVSSKLVALGPLPHHRLQT